jgi:hypothetical protein
MKRSCLLILLLATTLCLGQGAGYQASRVLTPVSAAFQDIALLQNSLIAYHQIFWTVTGAPAGCTVSIDSAPDGVTWTVGGVIAGQTCTSNGSSAVTGPVTSPYIRLNISALSGGAAPTVQLTYEGWAFNPAGSGGGLPVNNPSPTGVLTLPNGTATAPSLVFANSSTYGFYSQSATSIGIGKGGANDAFQFVSSGLERVISGGQFAWSSSGSDATTVADTGISRQGAAQVSVGNGTQGDETALFRSGDPCRLTTATTLTPVGTFVTFCSWAYVPVKVWAFQCVGTYSITAGTTPNLAIGILNSTLASGEWASARIASALSPITETSGFATGTTGALSVLVGATVTTIANGQWSISGVLSPSAAGTFSIQAAVNGTSAAGTINQGSTCLFY